METAKAAQRLLDIFESNNSLVKGGWKIATFEISQCMKTLNHPCWYDFDQVYRILIMSGDDDLEEWFIDSVKKLAKDGNSLLDKPNIPIE